MTDVVRVLVVDDQAPFRRAMTTVVEETEGFEVVGEVASGEDSVGAAALLCPDLVLMDVHLPGIDGLEATRRLLTGVPAPVVVLLSTDDEDAGDAYVAQSGAASYLTKSALGPDRLEAAWAAARNSSGRGTDRRPLRQADLEKRAVAGHLPDRPADCFDAVAEAGHVEPS